MAKKKTTAPIAENFEENMNPPIVEETPVKEEKTTTSVKVTADKLNVRASATVNANVLVVIDKGTVLSVDKNKSTKEWTAVKTESGIEGFVMSQFVK